LKILSILIFVETNKMTDLIGLPLEIITIRPNNTIEKYSLTKDKLKQIYNQLNTVIDEQIILNKIVDFANQGLIIE